MIAEVPLAEAGRGIPFRFTYFGESCFLRINSVRAARPEQSIAELVKGFSDGGLHHMPVVTADDRLVGMVTQSDLVAALFMRSPA